MYAPAGNDTVDPLLQSAVELPLVVGAGRGSSVEAGLLRVAIEALFVLFRFV